MADMGTRERILHCARKLILSKGEHATSMKAIADAVGVSRQAVYLHFADRTKLLLAVHDQMEEEAGLADWRREIEREHDGIMRLRRLAEIRNARADALKALVRQIEGMRHRDEFAAAAWRFRYKNNVKWIGNLIVSRLAEEGRIHPSWTATDAAIFLVVLFSFHAWDDLTHAGRWSAQHYVETQTAIAISALGGPCKIKS